MQIDKYTAKCYITIMKNINRFKKQKKAFKELKDLLEKDKIFVIHYSCESFYDIKDKATPRITSIVIKNVRSGQTHSFALHLSAEELKIPVENISDNYDKIEIKMLKDYFDFISKHLDYTWVHASMNDIYFGFQAIEQRYKVLGGKAICSIQDSSKINISTLLYRIYGDDFIDKPVMEKLIRKNFDVKDLLSGEEEAKAFNNKDYIKMHRSTLAKASKYADILYRVKNNNLLTNATFKTRYGLSMQSIFEYTTNTWWGKLLLFLIGSLVSAAISMIIVFN